LLAATVRSFALHAAWAFRLQQNGAVTRIFAPRISYARADHLVTLPLERSSFSVCAAEAVQHYLPTCFLKWCVMCKNSYYWFLCQRNKFLHMS